MKSHCAGAPTGQQALRLGADKKQHRLLYRRTHSGLSFPSPSNAKIIRTAARMARAFKGGFTALFVETPDFPQMNEADWERLRANIHLAEQLGATVETSYGEDVALQISEFARLSGVSKIILGRNNARRKHLLSKPTLTEQLVALSPNLDVYIIPDRQTPAYTEGRKSGGHTKFLPLDLLKSLLVLAAATESAGASSLWASARPISPSIFWACW